MRLARSVGAEAALRGLRDPVSTIAVLQGLLDGPGAALEPGLCIKLNEARRALQNRIAESDVSPGDQRHLGFRRLDRCHRGRCGDAAIDRVGRRSYAAALARVRLAHLLDEGGWPALLGGAFDPDWLLPNVLLLLAGCRRLVVVLVPAILAWWILTMWRHSTLLAVAFDHLGDSAARLRIPVTAWSTSLGIALFGPCGGLGWLVVVPLLYASRFGTGLPADRTWLEAGVRFTTRWGQPPMLLCILALVGSALLVGVCHHRLSRRHERSMQRAGWLGSLAPAAAISAIGLGHVQQNPLVPELAVGLVLVWAVRAWLDRRGEEAEHRHLNTVLTAILALFLAHSWGCLVQTESGAIANACRLAVVVGALVIVLPAGVGFLLAHQPPGALRRYLAFVGAVLLVGPLTLAILGLSIREMDGPGRPDEVVFNLEWSVGREAHWFGPYGRDCLGNMERVLSNGRASFLALGVILAWICAWFALRLGVLVAPEGAAALCERGAAGRPPDRPPLEVPSGADPGGPEP